MGVGVAGPRTRILVLTSEIELMRFARLILEPRGRVVWSNRVSGAPAAKGTFDIVIVDLAGPDLDQLRQVRRAYSDADVIALCGSYREADCIAILDLDADYLPRPFRQRDLAARVRVAELRRFNASGRRRFYRRGSFVIDLFDHKVAIGNERIALARTHLRILTLLARRASQVATFDRILAELGRADSASGRRALRSSIFRLRRRIERDPRRPNLLLTEPGVGYRLADESENEPGGELSAPRRPGQEGASS
jgi:two-component system, OmpR family, KDP operon response regulator KdpE